MGPSMSRQPLAGQPGSMPDPHQAGRSENEPVPARTRFVSLRLRLLGLVALVLVPSFVLVLYTQTDERKIAIANVNGDAMRLIRIATSNQAAQIEAARELLTAFARLPQLRTKNPAACNALLADMLTAYPLYLNFALAEADGNMLCSAVPLRSQVNVADRPYFTLALETRRFAVGDYQVGRITQLPSINYAYPVVDTAGNVEGVVFAAQSLSWLTVALSNVKFPQGAILVVTDRNGTVLARMPDAEGWIGGERLECPQRAEQAVDHHRVANDPRHTLRRRRDVRELV